MSINPYISLKSFINQDTPARRDRAEVNIMIYQADVGRAFQTVPCDVSIKNYITT